MSKQLYKLNLTNNIDVGGASTLTGALSVGGASTLGSTLSVDGASTLATTLSVGGASTLTGALSVEGASTLASTLSVGGDASIAGSLSVTGDINVEGNLITVTSQEVNIGDSFMYLQSENVSTTASHAGIVVNCKAESLAVDYDSGSVSVTDNAVTISIDATNFTANDLVQISNAATEKYNGIYEVESVSITEDSITLKTVPATNFAVASSSTLFNNTNASAWTGAKFSHVKVGVIKCVDGVWKLGQGNKSTDFDYYNISTASYKLIEELPDTTYAIAHNTTAITGVVDSNNTAVALPTASDKDGERFMIHNKTDYDITVSCSGSNINGLGTNDTVDSGSHTVYMSSAGEWVTI